MDQTFFFPFLLLCLIGLMITFKGMIHSHYELLCHMVYYILLPGVAGIDLSISYPNTVGGACMNEVATATCTVVSSNLQWRVSDDQTGAEYFNYLVPANEENIGMELTSENNVTVFQNNTIRNTTDFAQSLITSELRLPLSSSRPSVTITCSAITREERIQALLLG